MYALRHRPAKQYQLPRASTPLCIKECGLNSEAHSTVPRWRRWEGSWSSRRLRSDPLRDVGSSVQLRAPSGTLHTVDAFWDGDGTWIARFMPGELGVWSWTTHGTPHDPELHGLTGTFRCVESAPATCFERHGALRLSPDRRHLVHADGTPYFGSPIPPGTGRCDRLPRTGNSISRFVPRKASARCNG